MYAGGGRGGSADGLDAADGSGGAAAGGGGYQLGDPEASGCGMSGDVSQHGNWLPFRNERVNGEPCASPLTPHWFALLPKEGTLEFDFASTSRPARGTRAMSDGRFNVLVQARRVEECGCCVVRLTSRHAQSP